MTLEILRWPLVLISIIYFLKLNAQTPGITYKEQPNMRVSFTNEKPVIDGKVEEDCWKKGRGAKDFWQLFPTDSITNPVQTEIFMAYDKYNLYVAAVCYSKGNKYIIPSLKRDFRAGGNDNVTFVFDSYNDRTNAFVFGINPLGVMREAVIANGGRERSDFNENWDNKWHGEAFIGENYWSAEIVIPFAALRFKENSTSWNFNAYRFDTQSNTQSTWNHIPQNQLPMSLAFMSKIEFEKPIEKIGSAFTVIPYVSGGSSKNFTTNSPTKNTFGIGGDAKIGLSPSLNLDLTVNPDFSQVEVDRQVINLDRFEIFFPERRQFFLENADLFSGFGDQRSNPFFSRRIGIAKDANGNNYQVPILYGARLSGKLDNNWRVGLLNMHTRADPDNKLAGSNYTVAAVQRKLFSRSNIGFIFVDKENFTSDLTFEPIDPERFNRVVGVDYNLASSDNRWNGRTFYHQMFNSDKNGKMSDRFAHGSSLVYQDRKWNFTYQHQWIKSEYAPAVGFVPRNNFFALNGEISRFFYPKKGPINQYSFGIKSGQTWQPEDGRTDQELSLSFDGQLKNSGYFNVAINNSYIYLFNSFDPSRTKAKMLPAGSQFRNTFVTAFIWSDQRKAINYKLEPFFGQYFNGNIKGIEGGLVWRYQPYGSIEMSFNYSDIKLPAPYGSAKLLLVGPRIDFTFTKKLFLTTFIQYNKQVENLNINARLQWRFAPVSDLFIVYTDNYDTFYGTKKNRALVAKFTYWLNL